MISNILSIILVVIIIVVFVRFIIKGPISRAYEKLDLIDKKISEFNKKNFNSDSEKEIAKQQLKNELISIKNSISSITFVSTLGFRQQAMDKIIRL